MTNNKPWPVAVVQEEATGCGLAAVANILGQPYSWVKSLAHSKGISASDEALWSDTQYVRALLASQGVQTSSTETPFQSWESLPDLALLAIKHHQKEGRNFWHWVVFMRVQGQEVVLDSASYLPTNYREDFTEMQPKWFISVNK